MCGLVSLLSGLEPYDTRFYKQGAPNGACSENNGKECTILAGHSSKYPRSSLIPGTESETSISGNELQENQ